MRRRFRQAERQPGGGGHFGFATDVVPSHVQVAPRAGFNYDLSGNGTQQIRGGVGLFPGVRRTCGSRISSATPASTSRASARRQHRQPDSVRRRPAQPAEDRDRRDRRNVLQRDRHDRSGFKYPSVLRGNIGYDRSCRAGSPATSTSCVSNTINDIEYQNLNSYLPGVTGVGGRPFFTRKVTTLSDAILLRTRTRATAGTPRLKSAVRSTTASSSGSYSYGVAKSIMDGTSDQAASNWCNVYSRATRTTCRWRGRTSIRATASR